MIRKKKSTINNLNNIIAVIFEQIHISDVLEQKLFFDDLSVKYIAELLHEDEHLSKRYNKIECMQIAENISDYLNDRNMLYMRTSQRKYVNVIHLLEDCANMLLTIENDTVYCRYSEMDAWRYLSRHIGEELPVTITYVSEDRKNGKETRTSFSWDYVIRQNNFSLNRMMEEGISDHHFHLYGSGPHFQISWINLMNHPMNSVYVENLRKLDSERILLKQGDFLHAMVNGTVEDETYDQDSFVIMHLQAALIRIYLFKKIIGDADNMCLKKVLCKLQNQYELLLACDDIQANIASILDQSEMAQFDYAIRCKNSVSISGQEENDVLGGERWFIYSVIRDIYNPHILNRTEQNLFFAYLLLKNKFSRQMHQTNEKVGFDNFQTIQNRKWYFLGDVNSTKRIVQLALRAPLKQKSFLEIEVRISPGETAEDDWNRINEVDESVLDRNFIKELCGEENSNQFILDKFYYVVHFHKQQDVYLSRIPDGVRTNLQSAGYLFIYRHYRLRKKIERQTMALLRFREKYPVAANRVRGIDACAQEIGCRPEVFASVFRILSNHTVVYHDYESYGEIKKLPQLKKTYHVGEDFLDVTDGLRAIDEAIRFLDLDCGDRLGHAMALGIDVEEWYEAKNHQITLPLQDYIDNLAWLYHMLEKYQILDCRRIMSELKLEFDKYFRQVYLNHMDAVQLQAIMKEGSEYYNTAEAKRNYTVHECKFDIEDYYSAWKLRGDHPDLYERGFYTPRSQAQDMWDVYKTNRAYPRQFSTRYIPECSLLYYYYHFNVDVQRAGRRKITVDVDPLYIQSVKAVQKELQRDVARRGLAIETNPTSNVLIGMFREYQKHPIVSFYNKGLVHSESELRNCPQINVSINTDDKGVFYTCLENEFALMANALENETDKQGVPLYSRDDIYEWLNWVRQKGNKQGFSDIF